MDSVWLGEGKRANTIDTEIEPIGHAREEGIRMSGEGSTYVVVYTRTFSSDRHSERMSMPY